MRLPATPATRVLESSGVSWTGHFYEHDPRSRSYGAEAAQALGVDPARVFKTLVVMCAGKPALAMVPVSGSLDLKAAARALALAGAPHARSVEMADERVAESATGYVPGGISPLGTRRRLPCVIDSSVLAHDQVLVSGGRRGFDVSISPSELVPLAGAVTAEIAR